MNRVPPMFRMDSLNRADIATDLAIPIIAEGGWSALSLRAIARAERISAPAVLAWFGSTDRLHEAIAGRYGVRWLDLLALHLVPRWRDPEPDVGAVLADFLPRDQDEVVFARVWLTILEAGRHEQSVADAVARVEVRERELLHRHLPDPDDADLGAGPGHRLDLRLALVRGLRHAVCAARDPMPVATAAEIARAGA